MITSTRAAAVVAAVRLGKRAFRARDRKFLAEGPQAVREALACPGTVSAVFVTPEAASRHADLVAAAKVVHSVSGQVMEALAQTTTPQGIVAVCGFVDVGLAVVLEAAPRLSVLLAQVRDPGNAGTVIRVADAAGAGGVLLSHGSVDVYNAKCVRAGAGSMFHLPIAVELDTAATVATLRDSGVRVLAADGRGTTDLDDLSDSGGLVAPTTWIFGNEAWGLPAEVADLADEIVRVPIHGRAESLNLATAAAVCLYASARAQRRRG